MLNEDLIAQIAGIRTQQLTGRYHIQLGSVERRLYFEEGQLVLLDLGEDKELLLAKQYLTFHK